MRGLDVRLHRVSKLPLRQGIVYSGKAWTGKHELWLRSHTFATPRRQLAYDTALDVMASAVDRRNRLDKAIPEMAADSVFTPVVISWDACAGLDVDCIRAGRRDRRLDRLSGRSIGAYLGLVPTDNSSGSTRTQGRSPRPATTTPFACWSRRPGITGHGIGPAASCDGAGICCPQWLGLVVRRPTAAYTPGRAGFDERKNRRLVANAAIARELASWCWSLAVLDG
jgi:transposase